MKTKQILTLGVIFLVLIFAVIMKEMKKPAELATQEYVPLEISFDRDNIEAIDISRVKDVATEEEYFVQIVKKEGAWKVGTSYDARADENKIKAFLDEIANAKGELRAQSKDVFEDFGITDELSYRVVLLDSAGKDLLKLRIGTVKNRGRSIFVRREGEENVFMTDADIFGKVGIYGKPAEADLGTDFWVDLRLADYDTAKVISLETKTFDEGVETLRTNVVKENGQWKHVRDGLPFEIDQAKIVQHLDSIKSWRAQKTLEPDTADLGFDTPAWQMKIGFEGGENIILKAGNINEDAKAYYIYVSSEPVPFQLTHFYFENLSVDDSRFFKNNPLEIDEASLEKLIVASPSNTYEFAPATKTWQELSDYVKQLASFRAQELILDDAQKKFSKSPSKQYIEIKKTGVDAPIIIDFGKQISEESKEHAVSLRGHDAYPFILKASDIAKFFEGFDKITAAEPADAPVDARVEAESESEESAEVPLL